MTEQARNYRKTRVGVVVSDKMDKTIVVALVQRKKHPMYGKTVKSTKRLKYMTKKIRAVSAIRFG